MNLDQQRILITGGGVRVGKALSLAFAGCGAEILIHYRSSSDEAEDTAERIRTAGGKADTVCGDLAKEGGAIHIMEQACKGGRLHGLINNAAVFNRTPLADSSRQTFLDEFAPNLFGPLELMRAFTAQAETGSIINLLDRRIAAHDAGAVPYHLSKVALAEATRLAAIEFSPGFRVNGIAPGPILPPPGKEDEADYLQTHGGKTLLDHACSPHDIAGAAQYLFQAPAVTGQVIFIDAGQHLLGNGV